MSRKYYLDDGIEYHPDSGELFVDGRIENLQSLENKLLLHFVTRPNELISKEELYDVGWDGRIHGDNPLSKAISNIRSKLNDSPKDPKYIKTIPKKGFRFISTVSEQPTERVNSSAQLKSNTSTTSWSKAILLSAMTFVVLYLTVNATILTETPLSPQDISSFKQITHTNSQERDPHLSNDGRHLLFSRKHDEEDLAQLILKVLPNGDESQLTDNHFENLSPKWHSDTKRILYHRFNPEQCEIALIELNNQNKVISDKMLISCGKYSRNLGLSWGPDNSIYYSDIDIQFAPQKIYRLDLDSGKRTLVSEPPESDGRGYYRVHYDPQANQLYALLSIGWYETEVVTLSLDGERLSSHKVNMPLFSISSYNGMPVFRSTDNHIRYLDNGEDKLLMQSPLWPMFGPYFTKSDPNVLAFIGGVLNNRQLLQIDLDEGSELPLTSAEVSHSLPVMSASQQLYFVSNQSGINQIWRRTKGKDQVLSQFFENRHIKGIAITQDEHYLALYVNESIQVYQLNNLPLRYEHPYILLKESINPHFSPDSNTLWFSHKVDKNYLLKSIDLNSKRHSDVEYRHGYLGLFDQQNGQHLVFKYEQPGAWVLDNGQLKWYANAPLLSSFQSAVVDGNILTYFDDAQTRLIQLNLLSGEKSVLNKKGDLRYLTKVPGKTNQWIVSKKRFGKTDIFLIKY